MSTSIPFLGVGLSYRWSLHSLLMRVPEAIDWLEFTPEHFLPFNEDAQHRLKLLSRRFPLAGHSLELSLGSDGEDDPGYRESLAQMLALCKSVWHGEHACFTRIDDLPIRALTPVSFTDEAVETLVRNIRRVKEELGVPFVVENIAYIVESPLHTMSEAEFLTRVITEADTGLLLDLHNLLANGINHGRDPYRVLEALPLDRVVQVHIAGGNEIEGIYFDTHARMCPNEVFSMLDYVAARSGVRGVNFEMDSEFPPFERIVAELEHARGILKKHGLVGGLR